jgi:hypothetical protein
MRLIRRVCMEWNRVLWEANGRKPLIVGRKTSLSGRKLISINKIVMPESHSATWNGFLKI